jgi:hypothetical protein
MAKRVLYSANSLEAIEPYAILQGRIMRTFIETRVFMNRLPDFLGDEAFRRFQNELAVNPQKGTVMLGCGGLRKVRVEDESRGKGKRGGARVVYLDLPEAERIYLITIYGKNEQDDLTAGQKKLFANLAKQVRIEALSAIRTRSRRQK